MTLPRIFAATLLLCAGVAAAQQAAIDPRAPGSTLRDADSTFVLELTVEQAAGQTLDAGEFKVEVLGAEPPLAPPDAIFTDSFE